MVINDTQAMLLGLLRDAPTACTGGELLAAARDQYGPFWYAPRSQVYRELPAMHGTGLVKGDGVRTGRWSITSAGRRALVKWLDEAPKLLGPRDPVALRIALGNNAAWLRYQVEAFHIDALRDAGVAKQKAVKAKRDDLLLALQFAIAYHRAALAWVRKWR